MSLKMLPSVRPRHCQFPCNNQKEPIHRISITMLRMDNLRIVQGGHSLIVAYLLPPGRAPVIFIVKYFLLYEQFTMEHVQSSESYVLINTRLEKICNTLLFMFN